MKLRKNIYKPDLAFKGKFLRCNPAKLKRGDYLNLRYISYNQKKRGGANFRLSSRIFLLYKKKRHSNSLTFVVTSLYKHEKVKLRYLVSSPYVVNVSFVRKAQKNLNKIF